MESAKGIFEQMVQVGIKPDVLTYNTLLKGYCDKGDFESAEDVLLLMIEEGLKPDEVTYTQLMQVHSQKRNFIAAEKQMDRMQEDGIKPGCIAYNTLMSMYCKAKDFEQARKVLDQILQEGFKPEPKAFKAIIQYCLSSGRVEEAACYFKALKLGVPLKEENGQHVLDCPFGSVKTCVMLYRCSTENKQISHFILKLNPEDNHASKIKDTVCQFLKRYFPSFVIQQDLTRSNQILISRSAEENLFNFLTKHVETYMQRMNLSSLMS